MADLYDAVEIELDCDPLKLRDALHAVLRHCEMAEEDWGTSPHPQPRPDAPETGRERPTEAWLPVAGIRNLIARELGVERGDRRDAVKVESSEIARLARRRMERHEAELYEGGESHTFDDPDGGLLRYGAALRRVLALCDTWDSVHGVREFRDRIRQAIGYEMGVTEAPPPGSGEMP